MKALKPIFLCLAIALLFTGCNGTSHSPASADKNITSPEQRQALVKELSRLKAAFASGDRPTIASFFSFPVDDSLLHVLTMDTTFRNAYETAGNQLTKPLFMQYYPLIAENLEIDHVNTIFRLNPLSGLLHKDTLQHEVHAAGEPCSWTYSIMLEGSTVTLEARSERNPDYKTSTDSTGDESDMEGCEFAFWLIFRFDGEKLVFIKYDAAG